MSSNSSVTFPDTTYDVFRNSVGHLLCEQFGINPSDEQLDQFSEDVLHHSRLKSIYDSRIPAGKNLTPDRTYLDSGLLTQSEVASALGLIRQTVVRLLKSNVIDSISVGGKRLMYDPNDVRRLLDAEIIPDQPFFALRVRDWDCLDSQEIRISKASGPHVGMIRHSASLPGSVAVVAISNWAVDAFYIKSSEVEGENIHLSLEPLKTPEEWVSKRLPNEYGNRGGPARSFYPLGHASSREV